MRKKLVTLIVATGFITLSIEARANSKVKSQGPSKPVVSKNVIARTC